MSTELIWAQFHSATISLDAFGRTREEALALMQDQWESYATETHQDTHMINKNAELLKFVTVGPGEALISAPRPAVRSSKPGPEAIRPRSDEVRKTLSIREFENLVAGNTWEREQSHEIMERYDRRIKKRGEEQDSYIPHVRVWVSKLSTLDDIRIVYNEEFSYDEHDADSLSAGQNVVWTMYGVSVVDEDGLQLDAHDLAEYLNSDFSSINYAEADFNGGV